MRLDCYYEQVICYYIAFGCNWIVTGILRNMLSLLSLILTYENIFVSYLWSSPFKSHNYLNYRSHKHYDVHSLDAKLMCRTSIHKRYSNDHPDQHDIYTCQYLYEFICIAVRNDILINIYTKYYYFETFVLRRIKIIICILSSIYMAIFEIYSSYGQTFALNIVHNATLIFLLAIKLLSYKIISYKLYAHIFIK